MTLFELIGRGKNVHNMFLHAMKEHIYGNAYSERPVYTRVK